MAEILSQNEIDALLNALTSGEVDVQEIQDVDESERIKKNTILEILKKNSQGPIKNLRNYS